MTKSHIQTGKRGEDIATEYLVLRGYRILERNCKTPSGEIDLIALHNGDVVFVEVKSNTRQSEEFRPSVRVDAAKVGRVRKAAEFWLSEQEEYGLDFGGRIDVIEVCGEKVVEHFEDITGF